MFRAAPVAPLLFGSFVVLPKGFVLDATIVARVRKSELVSNEPVGEGRSSVRHEIEVLAIVLKHKGLAFCGSVDEELEVCLELVGCDACWFHG